VKFQENIAKAFVVFFKDPWTFIFATLFALLLTCVTLGILGPVMWLGMGEMFKKVKNGGKAAYEELFVHMDKAIMLAVLGLLIAICVGLGTVLLIVPGIMIGTLCIYCLYFMAEKGFGIMDSVKMSASAVLKNNFMNHILMTVAIWMVLSLGGSIFIGIVVAYPLCAGFTAFMFEQVKDK
jgi:uncharacterized membrane protein